MAIIMHIIWWIQPTRLYLFFASHATIFKAYIYNSGFLYSTSIIYWLFLIPWKTPSGWWRKCREVVAMMLDRWLFFCYFDITRCQIVFKHLLCCLCYTLNERIGVFIVSCDVSYLIFFCGVFLRNFKDEKFAWVLISMWQPQQLHHSSIWVALLLSWLSVVFPSFFSVACMPVCCLHGVCCLLCSHIAFLSRFAWSNVLHSFLVDCQFQFHFLFYLSGWRKLVQLNQEKNLYPVLHFSST